MAVATKVQIGTVSEGTLRTDDLVDAFESTLRMYAPEALAQIEAEHGDAGFSADGEIEDKDAADAYLSALTEALEMLAPSYAYFGTTDGDGACFGFWPDIVSAETDARYQDGILKIAAGDQRPTDVCCTPRQQGGANHGSGCPLASIRYILEVTDHGNASLYDIAHVPANFTGDEVWGIV